MDLASHDAQLRQAAFDHVSRLIALQGVIFDSTDLAGGSEFGGQRFPLVNPQRGIFKPRAMSWLLSIRTVFRDKAGASATAISATHNQQIYSKR